VFPPSPRHPSQSTQHIYCCGLPQPPTSQQLVLAMSYFGALQSALFYFLACTPCYNLAHVYKTRKEAKREREIKARLVTEQPHLYRHPDPFHTNPYWEEEIRLGPHPPTKKRKGSDGFGSKRSLSQRRLTVASRDGRPSTGAGSSVLVSMTELNSPRPSTSPTLTPGLSSSPTVVQDDGPASPTLSKTASIATTTTDMYTRRYQREDEELWGHESSSTSWSAPGHRLMDAIKHAGSTAGRYMESKLGGGSSSPRSSKAVTDEDRYNFYFAPRNPPVNEYHPPVVSSRPMRKDELKWMLQPPPPAKFMDGKVPVSRSASTMSVASSVATRRTLNGQGSVREPNRSMGSLNRVASEKGRVRSASTGEKSSVGNSEVGENATGAAKEKDLRSVSTPSPTKSRSSNSNRSSMRRRRRAGTAGSGSIRSPSMRCQRRRRRETVTSRSSSDADSESDPNSDSEDSGSETNNTSCNASSIGRGDSKGKASVTAARKARLSTIKSSEGQGEKVTLEGKDKHKAQENPFEKAEVEAKRAEEVR